VVPLRIDKEVLDAVDRLVELGVFRSRTEALRELVKTGLKAYEKLTRIAEGVERLLEIEEKEGEIPVKLDGGLKMLLKERELR
jgi:Arc/MetJ-type ribon-helix-helix transcriptional regulator